MYKVKATRRGGTVTFACGTAEQAMGKLLELTAQGLADIRVIDPAGVDTPADDFKRKFFADEV